MAYNVLAVTDAPQACPAGPAAEENVSYDPAGKGRAAARRGNGLVRCRVILLGRAKLSSMAAQQCLNFHTAQWFLV